MRFLMALYRPARSVFTLSNIPAAIALVCIVALGIAAELRNRDVFEEQLRARSLVQLNTVRAQLESNINSNIQLVRGMVATLSFDPDMSEERFAALAEKVFRDRGQLRNVAAAPGLVVSMVYPRQGNEKVIGLDYNKKAEQRDMAVKARDSGQLVFAGPVNLKQGGQGFIARFPVFTARPDGKSDFWGILSAVIDVDRLYRESGLFDPGHGLDIAISGTDGTGAKGAQFFGKLNVFSRHPVVASVQVPYGTWRIAAVPTRGWDIDPPNAWMLRFLMGIVGALVVVPIWVAGRLFASSQRHHGDLKGRERELRALSHRLELALEVSKIGVWEHDVHKGELIWDDRINEIYGKPRDGKPRNYVDWIRNIHPDDVDAAIKDFHRALDEGHYSSEYRVLTDDGRLRYVRTRAVVVRETGEPTRMIGAEWDVTADVKLARALERAKTLAESRYTELEVAKARIEHDAMHDSLTGLPNRRYLDDILARHATGEETGRTALLQIDLDRFKQINDTLGHAAGDAMLVHAAEVIRNCVRPQDFVARVGGDEYVVVCRTSEGTSFLSCLAEKIISRMREPVPFEGHQCRFGVSIGIAVEGADEKADPKRLMVNADIALYRAKSLGRNRHEFFTGVLQAEVIRTKQIADDILGGLERSEFIPYYQPQVDPVTYEIVGVEALARWIHPTEGMLTPDKFLKTAEDLDVVATIDKSILHQVLAQTAAWKKAGIAVPHMSVNVSARRLGDEGLIKGLRELNIEPGTMSFELLESIFLDDNDDMVASNVDRIKDLGIDIEIDDFGTGYASIIGLMKLKPRRLKIDRQLITPVVDSERQRQLVQSIIDIGKSLGVDVVAEGVETMEHARILRTLGCDRLQGYAFARPMSAAALETYMREQRATPSLRVVANRMRLAKTL
jgi:diguanylate cyclase (GGDEF)-like protein